MKKDLSKYIKQIAFSVFFLQLLVFSSCSGVIFHTIRDEVKLADAVVSGDCQNIIRYKDSIYVSVGKIKTRNVSSELVTKKTKLTGFSSPSGEVFQIAADSSNLYALSMTYEKDDDGFNSASKRTLWTYNGGKWKSIWSKPYNEDYETILFCTNTSSEANRHAYFRYGKSVFELSGEELGENGMATGSADNSTVPTASSKSCTVLGSTVYFSSANAMASNESPDSESTCIYYSDGDKVYYSKDGSNWESSDLGCDTIYSLAVTSDYLLAGTYSGIVHTPLTDWAPSSGTADFSSNADSTLSSYYEIPALLVIDSSKPELAATIFATCLTSSTSASLNNVGLWSYFPNSSGGKGEWNRE